MKDLAFIGRWLLLMALLVLGRLTATTHRPALPPVPPFTWFPSATANSLPQSSSD
ncbi:hypothetical protein [Hymenobacter negativus]|uniref:Uncharacterized protein n=1 Tax=Hymenobacter negativus TaxID=2795026 RepID=A0ABS3Q9G0_9BACT|nr:hypothetical protein [Hymenobacter negativus]MBO2007761.1 hypothetical protein [Hymenobacter negativus]